MTPEFKLVENSMQHRFLKSRAKVQLIGGGFGNGKTTAMVQKGLRLAKLYPGSNGLMARSTYPKLNDTLRKEFLRWCPASWIKSFPMSANASNTCTLKNGTTINFRYISQQGKTNEASTSNLLSATFDWIIVDQIEDPEIVEKDFDDLLGRLRGNTPFIGDRTTVDPLLGDMDTMPSSGPRWFIMSCNPTRNWVYKKLVHPLKVYESHKEVIDTLLCVRDPDTRKPVLRHDGSPSLLIDLFEGSTYENKHVLGSDFIQTLESAYQGQMRDRFLLGKWAAYEGLVYPMWDETLHCLPQQEIRSYITQCWDEGYDGAWIEGYDFGMAEPSCYLLSYVDPRGNVLVVDGFYRPEMLAREQAAEILRIRNSWGVDEEHLTSYADPDIFRRKAGRNVVGHTIANMLAEDSGQKISFIRGNNDILNGIQKVQGYLSPVGAHRHPLRKTYPAPYFYTALELTFINDEMNSYYWSTDNHGVRSDKPMDGKDHALDAIKYMLSRRPNIASIRTDERGSPAWMKWHERDVTENTKRARYGGR